MLSSESIKELVKVKDTLLLNIMTEEMLKKLLIDIKDLV